MASCSCVYPFAVFLGLCVTGLEAVLCKYRTYNDDLFHTYEYEYHYCSYSCCGPYYHQHCCGTRIGLIAGSITGGVIFIALIVTLVFWCRRYRLSSRFTSRATPPPVVYHNSVTVGSYPTTATTIQYPSRTHDPPPTYDMVARTPVAHDNYCFKH